MARPTILLISTLEWAGPVAGRVAMALHAAGFVVAALAPPHDVVRTVKAVSKIFTFRSWGPKRSVLRALRGTGAHFVVPCDDPAVSLLHQIHAERDGSSAHSPLRKLIERSLGHPDSFSITRSKSALIEHARHIGLRVPDTRVVPNVEALESSAAGLALPYMIKADGSWGGMDVTLVRGIDEARAVFARTTAPSWPRVVKRMIDARTLASLVAKLRREAPIVTVQQYVPGRPAHRAVVCWQGEILAGISYEALCVAPAKGAATVVRLIQHAEMEHAAARLVRSLRVSGFCCCDFVIENESGHAVMLELNPRATQTCHLVPAGGQGLAAAFFERATGVPTRSAPHPVISDVVALFAREWTRDPASPHLQTAYHDVPWSEPEFVLACMHLERRRRLERRRWTDHVRDAIRAGRPSPA